MHQLTPTYKQAVHFEMAAILQPLTPPPLFIRSFDTQTCQTCVKAV